MCVCVCAVGDVPADARRQTAHFTVHLETKPGVDKHLKNFYPTGWYLAPNEETTITVLNPENRHYTRFSAYVGFQTDSIPKNKDYMRRMPVIHVSYQQRKLLLVCGSDGV